MDVSIVIVTKNRAEALAFTLEKIQKLMDCSKHEVLVFIDGCEATEFIKKDFAWVKWFGVSKSIGASPARNQLYKHATGAILIGLDDDAHPITASFIEKCTTLFHANLKLGIIAFQEVRGVFESDDLALEQAEKEVIHYQTNDFIGCGFAIKKEVYQKTNGFPLWMDIYGEETCVAYEVLDADYEIIYDNSIIVNHRVNKKERQQQGKYYFRFQKQLLNSAKFFFVYYKFPFFKIIKLFLHNFKKYACTDFKYFTLFLKSFLLFFIAIPALLKWRKPLGKNTFEIIKNAKSLKY